MEYLTKSAVLEFEQCAKRFWLSHHRPELAGPPQQDQFVDGNRLGSLARTLVPGELVYEPSPEAALNRTRDLLANANGSIFEAAFMHEGVFVRTDVLTPERDGWHLAEVKASSAPKSHHIADLATQVWVAKGAGVAVTRASIRHVNTTFRYEGGGDYRGLVIDADLTEQLGPILDGRQVVIDRAKGLIRGNEPVRAMGPHCSSPFDCPFVGHCESTAPSRPEYPVSLLPGQAGKKVASKLLSDGFYDLRDVPDGKLENADHIRIHNATRSGQAFHDRDGLVAAVGAWPWPRYYLDFETIAHVIPPWPGRRPYEQVPFQFSCHVEQEDGALEHKCFLDTSGADPSRACADALLSALGDCGAIITYNLPTERSCIRNLAERHPDLEERLLAVADRLVDLLPLVKTHYYHPAMRGSYSIKVVLPAAAPELSYKDLGAVQDGRAAQVAWLEATDPQTTEVRRTELGEQLLRYCELDTRAMVALVRNLASERL